MSNNLRQIAKDLRSFVKRCKDVHYSDSLLITFLVTGLLTTFAPSIIRADVAEDQQEVSAQAYDTITDLRQSFLRAKKENQKALRGANAELAQLLKQGDQVVKSPWASFQFGTGYTNNDWGTAYKGRGGKKLEYYSRTNDLTKYVFDASKHQYGATNLNIARNEEPNSLAINPANLHEPYRPYAIDKLSAISLPDAPSFGPQLDAPGSVTRDSGFTINVPTPSRSVAKSVEEAAFRVNDARYNNTNMYSGSYGVNNIPSTVTATMKNIAAATPGSANGTVSATAAAKVNAITAAVPTKYTFLTADTSSIPHRGNIYNTRHWWRNGPEVMGTRINNISGNFNIGKDSDRSDKTSWKYDSGGSDTPAKVYYNNVSVNGGSAIWGEDEANASGGTSSVVVTPNGGTTPHSSTIASNIQKQMTIEYLRQHPYSDWNSAWAYVSSLPVGSYTHSPSGGINQKRDYTFTDWNGTTHTFVDGQTYNVSYYQTQNASGVNAVIYNPVGVLNVSGTQFNFDGTTSRIGIATGGASGNVGTVKLTGTNTFYIAPTSVNAKHSAIAVFQNGNLEASGNGNTFTIDQAAVENNAIYNAGKVTLNGGIFNIYSKDSNGIKNDTANSYASITSAEFNVSGKNANAISNEGVTTAITSTFSISGLQANAINNTGTTTVRGGTFSIDNTDSNGIVNTGKLRVEKSGSNRTVFTLNQVANSTAANAIRNDSNTPAEVYGAQFNINPDKSNGILNLNASVLTVSGNEFNVSGTKSNGISNPGSGTIHVEGTDNKFYISGGEASGIHNNGTVSATNFLFDINRNATPVGTKSSGIINAGSGLVSLSSGIFNVYQNQSNGVDNANGGTVSLDTVTFNIGDTTPGNSYNNAYQSTGVRNNGTLEAKNSKFVVNAREANGIYNAQGKTANIKYTDFKVSSVAVRDSNAISTNGTLSVTGGTFTIDAPISNAIITDSNATKVVVNGADFTLNANATNGINNEAGSAPITVTYDSNNGYHRSSFTGANGIQNSNGIYTNGTGNLNVSYSDFTFDYLTNRNQGSGQYNNGIYINNGTGTSAAHNVSYSTFNMGSPYSNGIAVRSGASLGVSYTNFNLNGYASNAIRITDTVPVVNVTGGTIDTVGSFSNGIYATATMGTGLTVTGTGFTIKGSNSNGIYASNNNSTTGINALKVTGGTMDIQGNNSNGIYADIADGKNVEVDGTTITTSGSGSNGIYAKTGKLDLQNAKITVDGTNSNGLLLESVLYGGKASDKATIKNTRFYVNTPNSATDPGAYNNGIYVGGGRTITEISGTAGNKNSSTFVLNQNASGHNNNIGILVGDSTGKGTISKISETTFDIKSTNANRTNDAGGTGIYMYDGDVTVDQETTLTGDSNDVFITIRNREHNNTLTMKSGSNMGQLTSLQAVGNNNIGINIQEGNSHFTKHATLKIANTKASPSDGWALNFVGSGNIGIKNNFFAKTLTIKNVVDTMPLGGSAGSMRIDGEKGIMFANLGYVHEGTLQLDGVSMVGKNSTIAAFLNNNYNKTAVDRETANAGLFKNSSDGIKLRGTIGSTLGIANSDGTRNSANSVGIYANTGQSAGTGSDVVAFDVGTASTGPLTINSLSIGLGAHATNSTVLWADRGTHITVENNAYPTNGGANHLSDGVMQQATVSFGYNVNDEHASYNSVYAYATGYFSKGSHGYTTTAGPSDDGSKIVLSKQLDLVSRHGTALLATDGGIIEAKAVRAGGHDSILAYADANGGKTASITIDGNIVAADNNLLGVNNRGTYAVSSTGDVKDTYQNIGAVALNGSNVTIKNATRAADIKEGHLATETGLAADTKASLIYGMAAYAKGRGSSVVFDKTKAAAATVVTGKYGALYATENATIEFAGDIINQNNVGSGSSSTISTIAAGKATGVLAGSRNGRGTAATVGIDNDHVNTTPFYVSRGANEGKSSTDSAGILFNENLTKIDMYDGILLTGNVYGGNGLGDFVIGKSYEVMRDYYKEDTDLGPNNAYTRAKYRGMKNVTAAIMKDKYAVNLGIINQANGLKWTNDGNTNTTGASGANYLGTIGKNYVGEMGINNAKVGTPAAGTNTHYGNRFKSTLLNSELEISATKVNLEDADKTDMGAEDSVRNDPFNDITMESTLVTIKSGTEVLGDIANGYRAGQGLNMNNSLGRWENVDGDINGKSKWIKTQAANSGYINKGKINVWGGTKQAAGTANIAGMNVVFGTARNDSGATIDVDHGFGIFATDSSNISNQGTITVTGKYSPTTATALRTTNNFTNESVPTGNNYGIVGISKGRATYAVTNEDGNIIFNKITINNINGKIKAEGDLAVGIYAENRGDALKSDIQVSYEDTTLSAADGIDVVNTDAVNSNSKARGVGIAIVNSNTTYTSGQTGNVGGTLTLNGKTGNLGSFTNADRNIYTGKNGIGIYVEGSNVNLLSKTFTVETADNGVGLWGTDNTNVAVGTNSAHNRTFQYNYNGAKDQNGFAMAFSSKNVGITSLAQNDLDIKFSNKADNAVTLAQDKANSNSGTSKGIAGILVNTNDINDVVINRGNIEEETSKTHVRAYGALVNQGTFRNFGDITLAESLLHQANDVERADMDKVNVGIRANNLDRTKTKIEHHGDIKIGDTTSGKSNTTSAKNIGSWAIYGTNIETGQKLDGKNSQIVINRNSYGIYSGDGNVTIAGTDIKVGNDTVLGHKMYSGKYSDGTPYTIDRQGGATGYAQDADLLSKLGRERDSAIGVYIDNNDGLSNTHRTVKVNADMEIDRFSHGIVLAERNGDIAVNKTTVELGTAGNGPTIKLAYSTNNNQGGHVKSTKPTDNPEKRPREIYEQGNSVYYYSADNASAATTYANVTMDGDYNTAYFTRGSVENYGTIDLRSQYDLDKRALDPTHEPVGYGNVGIISENTKYASVNYGTITTGLSDTTNMMYSVAMGAGRNHYRTNDKNEVVYDRTDGQGYVENRGTINVQEKAGIGMLATGRGSKAVNRGTINLIGENSIGMYIDRSAVGENYGTITGNAQNLKGVIAINGGFIKNYGVIDIQGTGSTGIMTDSSKFATDANGKVIFDADGTPIQVTDEGSPQYATAITAGQANGKTNENRGRNDGSGANDQYGSNSGVTGAVGSETSIEEGTTGNPKTTGVGTTISRPNVVPLTTVTIDGVQVPITHIDTDAKNIGDYANNITLRNSIQTGGTRIIDLRTRDEYGNPAWANYGRSQSSEVTNVGMYIDTSGVRYTNPFNGLQNLTRLGKVNLYFGPEATVYTNAKAIKFGDVINDDGTIERSNILKPFNDALRLLPGGAVVNPLSASLTWQVSANIDDNNQITEVVMSKVPYHSFAFDSDKSLVNFTNNLDNLYEIARPGSEEKMIFNRLNSLGNGEGHILAQAFDQMRGHIYGGIQQRTNATSNLLTDELAQLRSENNASKDSNKIKAFGRREEYKTDTAGLPDWHSNAGGFVYLHEDETVKLGDRSGWYAGAVNNYFTFKDLARSYENQAMLKTGIFKQTPLDEDGTFTFTIGGDAFFGKTNTKRRFWVVDKEFRAKSDYYTYGADINAKLEKEFRLTEGFSIVPNVGLDLQYGRFSTVNEDGDMALKIKSDDYYSVKPRAGVDFRYSQPVFKKSNFVASVGLSYETELGRLNDVENEAKIKGAWTDYYTIKGDKEDRKGNFKSDLKLGLDNGRLGFTVNTGYDTKGHNFRAGLGLRALF